MAPELMNTVIFSGVIAAIAALIYAIGGEFFLSGKVNLADRPRLEPHAKTLSSMERMAELSNKRLIWGGLLGVIATPPGAGWILAGLLGVAASGSRIGAATSAAIRCRHSGRRFCTDHLSTWANTFRLSIAWTTAGRGSFWRCMLASERTLYPRWMAAVNPPTMLLVWFGVKKLLPRKVAGCTEGAGFNIAYLFFFALSTLTLWQAAQMG